MAPPKRPVKKEFRNAAGEEIVRVRLPKGEEVIGILEQRLGGSRNEVRCLDGKTRNCRIPGRLKRRLWVRAGDVVLVEPWEFDGVRVWFDAASCAFEDDGGFIAHGNQHGYRSPG